MTERKGRSPIDQIRRIWGTGGVRRVLMAFVALILLCVLFAVFDPSKLFGSEQHVGNLIRNCSPILLIGIGQSIVLITGNIDLSIGSVMGMSGMISATLLSGDMPPLLAVAIALACCVLVGLVNGEIVARLKVPSYIATLGTLLLCRGIAQVSNGNFDTGYIGHAATGLNFRDFFFYGRFLGVYSPIWIGLFIWAVCFFLLAKTRTGRHFYALGSNLQAFRLSGVSVFAATDKAYVISALCAGIAGFMTTAEAGYGAINAGSSYELYAVAVAVIGGISPIGGRGLLLGTLFGAAIWGVLQNGLVRLELGMGIRNIVIGIIVIVTIILDVSGRYRRTRPRR